MAQNWDDLRVFLAVARAESLSRAGQELRMDPATVGRRIARLEDTLGVILFVKSPQGYALTEAGERMLEPLEVAEAALVAGQGAVTGADEGLSGTIRIGGSQVINITAGRKRQISNRGMGNITRRVGVDEIINGVPYTTGTIHCSALTAPGADLAGCTTTSGLSWKLPGRVGDSPIIGARLYTDNEVGSPGATGRGEAVIQICGAHTIVMRMEAGDHPRDACLYALQKIADCTRVQRLLDEQGRPNFNVVFYAVRKDGQFGSACMRGVREFAVADAKGARLERCAALYD